MWAPNGGRVANLQFDHVADEDLNESQVLFAGDWHGNIGWVQKVLPFIRRSAPGLRTILHVGDFGFWPERQGKGFLGAVDYWSAKAGIEHILVTPGNHEHWPMLTERFAASPGEAVQMSAVTWALPRGFRFSIGGRTLLSFGGAASVDFEDRRLGRDWWPEEMPTDRDVELAIAGGPVEILITHEAVNGGTPAVDQILTENPQGWGDEALDYAARSRGLVTRVWDAVHPEVLVHGHLHRADGISLPDGRRVFSLGCDQQDKNLALVQTGDLKWQWLQTPR